MQEDGTQNYLVFHPINKYFKVIANTDYASSWKSQGLSSETITPPTTSDNSLTPTLNYYGTKTYWKNLVRVKRWYTKFAGSCLKQNKITCTHGKTVNNYIVYELDASGSQDNGPTLENSFCINQKLRH